MKKTIFLLALLLCGCSQSVTQIKSSIEINQKEELSPFATTWIEEAKQDEQVIWEDGNVIDQEGVFMKAFFYRGNKYEVEVSVLSNKAEIANTYVYLNIDEEISILQQKIDESLGEIQKQFVLTSVPDKPLIIDYPIVSNDNISSSMKYFVFYKDEARLNMMSHISVADYEQASTIKTEQNKEDYLEAEFIEKVKGLRILRIIDNKIYTGEDLINKVVVWGYNYTSFNPIMYGGLLLVENPGNLEIDGLKENSMHEESIKIYQDSLDDTKIARTFYINASDISFDEYLRR